MRDFGASARMSVASGFLAESGHVLKGRLIPVVAKESARIPSATNKQGLTGLLVGVVEHDFR